MSLFNKTLNVLLCLLPVLCQGQTLDIVTLSAPDFSFNSTTELEAGAGVAPYTLITNSFYLRVSNKNKKTCQVYVSIPNGITRSGGATTDMPVSNIKLRFRSTNAGSNASNILTGDVPMTTSNPGTRLFSQRRRNNTYNYYYDVALPTIGYTYSPGTYSYTFLFTMTLP